MLALWPASLRDKSPALFINSTNVEDGVPFIISNLALPSYAHIQSYYAYQPPAIANPFNSYRDEPLVGITNLPLSAAVHLSARFSYVNPPATLLGRPSVSAILDRPYTQSTPRPFPLVLPWGRLVDGGYYDNAGAGTTEDIMLAVKGVIERWNAEQPGQAIEPEYLSVTILNNPDIAGASSSSLDQGWSFASGKTIPDRPRELPIPKLNALESRFPDKRAQATLSKSTTWSTHVDSSDFRSPIDAFNSTRGGHELGTRIDLARTASLLSAESIHWCYNRLYSNATGDPVSWALDHNRAALNQVLECAPYVEYSSLGCEPAGEPRGEGPRPEAGDDRTDAIIQILRSEDFGAGCYVPNANEDISFGTYENAITAAGPQAENDRSRGPVEDCLQQIEGSPPPFGEFENPALGWWLSKNSCDSIDYVVCHITSPPSPGLPGYLRYDFRPSQIVGLVNRYARLKRAPLYPDPNAVSCELPRP